jgi:rhodanese-related sulfurtransferase
MKLKYIIIIIIFVLVPLLYFMYRYAIDSPYRINSDYAKQLIKEHKIDLILDVRTNLERTTLGFYPGSVHIQSSELEDLMPKYYPDRNISILAYCNSGQRARIATEKLHALGYVNAVYIATAHISLM